MKDESRSTQPPDLVSLMTEIVAGGETAVLEVVAETGWLSKRRSMSE